MKNSKSFNPTNVQEELHRLYNIPENEILPSDARELNYFQILEERGVEYMCGECSGLGVKGYGSTATWHGGVGGQAMTSGVCDHCWGSGDHYKKWPSHRVFQNMMR
jgi:hypothetical protein